MTRALRDRIAERIRAFAGLDPPPWLLDARLAERARALGLGVDAYLDAATGDGPEAEREREALAGLLRVGETRFFRHRAQLRQLTRRALPERARVAADEARPLAAWSAGCATGEEAWTLALLCEAAQPPRAFELLASDLSAGALAVAARAVYAEGRREELPPAERARAFDGDRIAARLRARVRFEHHNLSGARYPSGPFDVILCRNVLIYFDAQKRGEAIARLAATLHPGGYLFLGYSETLRDHEPLFEALPDEDGVLYRRRATPAPAAAVALPSLAINPSAREPTIELALPAALPAGDAVPVLALSGEYTDGERLQAELKPCIQARRAVIDLDGAAFLGDDAARVLKRAAEAAPGLSFRASRPAVRRWLERHGLA